MCPPPMHTTSKLNFTPFRCHGASLYLQSKPFFSSDIKCVLDWHRSSGHGSQAEQKGSDSVPSFGWSCFYQHFTLVYFSFENIYLWQNIVIDFVHIFNFHFIRICMGDSTILPLATRIFRIIIICLPS